MRELTYTLVADGSSDRCLERIITWAVKQATDSEDTLLIETQFADYRDDPRPPKGLIEKLERATRDFPCDILFAHRDAERGDPVIRRSEILEAAKAAGVSPIVCIIPVRMTEAWLLFSEAAIRKAAGNPNGNAKLNLPSTNRVEGVPDPKALLHTALEKASEANGRRLKQFKRDLPMLKLRVAEYIDDFSPLRELTAFNSFEKELQKALSHIQRTPD